MNAPSTSSSSSSSSSTSLNSLITRCIDESTVLTTLSSHLSCPICYDAYHTPATLPCFHSFCSLCIRRTLYFHAFCPVCHAPATASDLRANFALGALSEEVKGIREKLTHELSDGMRDEWKRRRLKRPHEDDEEKEERKEAHQIDDEADECCHEEKKSNGNTSAAAASSSASSIASLQSVDKVECPICQLRVLASAINRHLDVCLGKEENRTTATNNHANSTTIAASSSSTASVTSRRPFPAYNMLSDKALKKLLTDAGFPSSASLASDRESLIRRHREFILRHNSECDSPHPLSDAMIVKEIVKKEKVMTSTNMSKNAKQSLLIQAFHTNGQEVSTNSLPLPISSKSSKKRSQSSRTAAASAAPASFASPPPTSPRKRLRNSPQNPPSTDVVILEDAEDLTRDEPMEGANDTSSTSVAPAASDSHQLSLDTTPTTATAIPPSEQQTASIDSSSSVEPQLCPISPSSTDPFAHLIAAYESQHGPRKRWRRAWGIDESLYKNQSPPAPAPSSTAASTTASSAASPLGSSGASTEGTDKQTETVKTQEDIEMRVDGDEEVTIDTSRTTAPSSKSKPVFSLFQPHSKETSSAATVAIPPASSSTSTPSSNSSSNASPSTSSKSSSGAIRVSSAMCSQCLRVCRGSFPLGASIVCPQCRPNWTQLAAAAAGQQQPQQQQRTTSQTLPPLTHQTSTKPNWQQLAALAVLSSATPVSTPAPSIDPPSSLTPEQRAFIEARKLAALEKLKAQRLQQQQQSTSDIMSLTLDHNVTNSAQA